MTGQTQGTPAPVPQLPEQFATTVPGLQAQIADLQIQLSGLQAQWRGLQSQLNAMLRNNPARPGVQQQWADVGIQIAKLEGDIARLQAQVAVKQGVPIGIPRIPRIPNFAGNAGVDPNVVIPAVTVLTMVLLLPVSIAWARRMLRRAPKPAPVSNDHTMRLERIEQAVDTIAIEVERISEGQRFVTKLLAERGTSIGSVGGSSNEAKQPLALGAGAMEPIVVAERERARERVVTPH